MPSSRATLIEVAHRAGVSLASTSRALHGKGASQEMTAKVRAAAAELGYSPDATGRSLRTKRTFQVAYAVADIGNPVYVDMLTAIHAGLAPSGYRVVVLTTGGTLASTRDVVRSLGSGFVDGMILSPLRTDDALVAEIRDAAVPVVVIGRALDADGVDSVSTDSAEGVVRAVEHLLRIGRRRIAFLNGPPDTTPGRARHEGFDRATGAGFVGESLGVEVADDFTMAAGIEATRALLNRPGPVPDAIVAANDLLAIGAIRAAQESGLDVPTDLAVTGMDDTEIGRVFHPSLTSVSLRSAERGAAAAATLLDRLVPDPDASRRGAPAVHVSIGPKLLIRSSTVPAAHPARKEDAS